MKDSVAHIGVVGVGEMGRRHALNLARGVPNAAECGAGRIFADARELIASPDVTHADLTLACIDVGKPILFRGYHYNLTDGITRSADDLITHSAVHDIHSAHWLMERETARVYVQSVPAEPHQTTFSRLLVIHLSFRGGGLGIIQLNADSGYGYEVYVEITGETGQATSLSFTAPHVRRAGVLSQAIEPDWLDRFDKACIHSIATGQPENVPLEEKPAFYHGL